MKKKSILILLIVLLLVTVSLTTAYIIRQTVTSSIITFGNLKMELIETEIIDGEEITVEDGNSLNVTHTSNVSRIVKVKNVGNHPMYVRLSVNIESRSEGNNYNPMDFVEIPVLENWVYQDGFYYYQEVLEPGETTTPLMNEMIFDNVNLVQYHRGDELILQIKAYAVQSEHNEESVLDAVGWPS